jgi:hypothetical protein
MLCPNLEFSQQLAAYPRGFFVKVTTRNQLSCSDFLKKTE